MKTGRIAVSLLFADPRYATGSFVYVQSLLDRVFAIEASRSFVLLLTPANARYFKERYSRHAHVTCVVVGSWFAMWKSPIGGMRKMFARVRGDRAFLEIATRGEVMAMLKHYTVLHLFFPSGFIYPRGLEGSVKIITTVFDLQHEYAPENFSSEYLARRKAECAYAVEHSHRLITISEFTKKSIIERYGVDARMVRVVYLAPPNHDAPSVRSIRIPPHFIFYPAAMWPHKNHLILIEALRSLVSKFPDIHLVCTGVVKNEKLFKELQVKAQEYGISSHIHFLGFVSDAQIALLFTKARILAFPSSFEGFGIPIVEAFRYRVPVVAADNTSISEIVGDAGILVKTRDSDALADALGRVWRDEDLREKLVERGVERLRQFSWDTAARMTIAIINEA